MTDSELQKPEPFEHQLLGELRSLNETLQELRGRLVAQEKRTEQIRHATAFPVQNGYFRKIVQHQLGYLETVEMVSRRRLSLARFGDGEITLACHAYQNIKFQKGSPELSRALQDVLSADRPGLLTAMPGLIVDTTWLTLFARYWGVLEEVLPETKLWGSSSVSRKSAFTYHGKEIVDAWRSCWAGRDITIVTGKGSRFEPIDQLFSGAKTLDFVYGPASNAFESIDAIQAEILSRERDLVLLSLGPAATVLAARLSDLGLQAIDVGHISNSYLQAFDGGPSPESLPVEKR